MRVVLRALRKLVLMSRHWPASALNLAPRSDAGTEPELRLQSVSWPATVRVLYLTLLKSFSGLCDPRCTSLDCIPSVPSRSSEFGTHLSIKLDFSHTKETQDGVPVLGPTHVCDHS
ncbi:hypothetical protein C8Q78DRAFT_675851 [Trametes maxima]|nr:hypothetical protein C8Q78DRAFT_675851 [Trametes maxima]